MAPSPSSKSKKIIVVKSMKRVSSRSKCLTSKPKKNSSEYICNRIDGRWIHRDSENGKLIADLRLLSRHDSYVPPPINGQDFIAGEYIKLFVKQLKYMEKIPIEYINVLKEYTKDKYTSVNKFLRDDLQFFHYKPDDKVINYVDAIDEVFRKIPPLKQDVFLWRGVTRNDGMPDNFVDKAYISTTLDKQLAQKFSGYKCCLYKIRVPKGTKVIPVSLTSHHSNNVEVLLPRDGQYTIVNKDSAPIVVNYKQPALSRGRFNMKQPAIEKGWTFKDQATLLDKYGDEWEISQGKNNDDVRRIKIGGRTFNIVPRVA